MPLTKINLENFTVFETMEMEFCDGINVFIGENGTGKTHVMKLLYAACQAGQVRKTAFDFQTKIVRVFRPDDFALHRLVRRNAVPAKTSIHVSSEKSNLSISFHAHNKKEIEESDSENWEKQFASVTSTFIPAKEILSHSRNLIQAMSAGNVDFDDIYKDIIASASVNLSAPDTERKKEYLHRLQTITQGYVKIENEEFYLLPSDQSQSKLEFQLVAEGMRKIALLWQLIKNGALEKGSILFWDEPEANINPQNIPAIVDLLLDLQEDGVQIFIATHDYFVAKYLDVRKKNRTEIRYHALSPSGNTVDYERGEDFTLLENNSIIKQSIDLYKEEVKMVME